jgi:hypothetical protein
LNTVIVAGPVRPVRTAGGLLQALVASSYFISLSPWAAGHTRMHSKHCAMFVDE